MRRLLTRFLSFGLAAAFVVLPAAAQTDPDANSLIRFSQSPEAEATFDLFENIYDIMLTPAPSAFIEQDAYFTQLGNVGGQDNFRFGFVRQVGPGNLVIRVASAMDEFQFSSLEDFTVDDQDAPFLFNDLTNDDLSVEFDDNNLFASYAWPLGGGGDQSLGFALVYDDVKFEVDDTFMEDLVTDSPPSTFTFTDDERFIAESETEAVTLIGEWMNQGNLDIRIRGLVQDLEVTERSLDTNDELILDIADPGVVEEQFTFFSSSLSDRTRDGQCYGAEVDLRWDNNPNVHHRLDVGIKTADLELKENLVEQDFSEDVFEDLVTGEMETVTNLVQAIAQDDDISVDSWFAVWKTWWHWNNVHFAAGGSVFANETELSAEGELVDLFTDVFDDGDGVPDADDFEFTSSAPGSFAFTEEFDITTYAIPVAVEIDLTGKMKVFFGAQYRYTDSEFEEASLEMTGPFSDSFVLGDGTVIFDDTANEFITDLSEDETESKTSESFYRAGFKYDVNERVSLQGLLAATSGGNSDRDGVDLDTVFFGVTVYGQRK
jgi:hypothetical protein